MTVHVWKDGTYIGQIVRARFDQIEVLSEDENERARLKELLLNAKAFAPTHDFELRSGETRRFYEFASDEWVDMAALLVLPREGYRVHVIQEPPRGNLGG